MPKGRPQLLGRAERTEEYVSTAKRRERRCGIFQHTPENRKRKVQAHLIDEVDVGK